MILSEGLDRRAEFPLTERMIYLDVAYHNILPTSVARAMETFCTEQLQGGGDPHLWEKDVGLTRAKFARLIGAEPEEIAFVKNTAEGLSIVASALPLRSDDNVVINDLEHPSNVYPWRNLERLGVQFRFGSSTTWVADCQSPNCWREPTRAPAPSPSPRSSSATAFAPTWQG